MTPARLRFCLSVSLLGLLSFARAQDSTGTSIPVPGAMFTAPSATVRAYAQKAGIPLDEVSSLRDGDARPGDTVIVLATLFDGGARRQWLIQLTMDKLDEREKSRKPDKDRVFHTSTGRTFSFHSEKAAVNLQTIGPLESPEKSPAVPPIKNARVLVNSDFLALEISQIFAVTETLHAFHLKTGQDVTFSCSTNPFPEKTIAEGKKMEKQSGLSEESERAFIESTPALMEFFQVLQDTPGIRDLLLKVFEKPSLWTVATHLGSMNFKFDFVAEGHGWVDAAPWKLGNLRIIAMPTTLRLLGKPALTFTLYASQPRPPLRACAGVVGIQATSIKDPNRFLVLRVISTRAAGGGP